MKLFLLQDPALDEYFHKMAGPIVCIIRIFRIFMISTLLLGSSYPVYGSEWQDTKALYDSGKYEEALQTLQKNPRSDFSYNYNLGTIYFRMGQLGSAVAYLEKANRNHPHDPDIQFNLSVAKSALGRSIGADHLDPSSNGFEQIADRISLDEVRAILGLLGMIVVLLWIRVYLNTRNIQMTFLQPAGLLVLLGFSMTFGIYAIQRYTADHPSAICLEKGMIRSGPGDNYIELAQTEAGSKLRLLGPSASDQNHSNPIASKPPEVWQQVRYSVDGIGWIKASHLLVL